MLDFGVKIFSNKEFVFFSWKLLLLLKNATLTSDLSLPFSDSIQAESNANESNSTTEAPAKQQTSTQSASNNSLITSTKASKKEEEKGKTSGKEETNQGQKKGKPILGFFE